MVVIVLEPEIVESEAQQFTACELVAALVALAKAVAVMVQTIVAVCETEKGD